MKIPMLLLVLPVFLFSDMSAEEIKLPEGFTILDTTSSYKTVLTPFATYPVMLEEYVPKTIIEGKWGNKQEEFGAFSYMNNGEIHFYQPNEFLLNSDKQIYILDNVNNRIKKYSKTGEYLLSIDVPAFQDKEGVALVQYKGAEIETIDKLYFEGISMTIDSNNNLYYYFRKGDKGEVWKISKDKVVAKWGIALANEWLHVDENDVPWVGDFNLIEKKEEPGRTPQPEGKFRVGNLYLVPDNISKSQVNISIEDQKGVRQGLVVLSPTRSKRSAQHLFVDLSNLNNAVSAPGGMFFLRYGEGLGNDMIVYVNEYNSNGKLFSIALNGRVGHIHSSGDGYSIEIQNMFRLIQWQRKRI